MLRKVETGEWATGIRRIIQRPMPTVVVSAKASLGNSRSDRRRSKTKTPTRIEKAPRISSVAEAVSPLMAAIATSMMPTPEPARRLSGTVLAFGSGLPGSAGTKRVTSARKRSATGTLTKNAIRQDTVSVRMPAITGPPKDPSAHIIASTPKTRAIRRDGNSTGMKI